MGTLAYLLLSSFVLTLLVFAVTLSTLPYDKWVGVPSEAPSHAGATRSRLQMSWTSSSSAELAEPDFNTRHAEVRRRRNLQAHYAEEDDGNRKWSAALVSNYQCDKGRCHLPKVREEERLQEDLFSNYNLKASPGHPTHVGLAIYMQKLERADASTGTLEVNAWVQMGWYDPRLKWEPSEYGGINTTTASIVGSTNADTMIWHPDFDLFDSPGLSASLSNQDASIKSDGYVYWSRNGIVKILCNFDGLLNFPFDDIECKFVGGGWTRSGHTVSYVLMKTGDPAHPVYGFEVSKMMQEQKAFFEFRAVKKTVNTVIYYYPSAPGEPWPSVEFTIRLRRALISYVVNVLFPATMLGFMSNLVYLIDIGTGERMGFAITLLLALIASQLVFFDLVPRTNHLLWADVFNMTIMTYATCAVGQTILCTALQYAKWQEVPFYISFLAKHLAVDDFEDPMDVNTWVGKWKIENIREQMRIASERSMKRVIDATGNWVLVDNRLKKNKKSARMSAADYFQQMRQGDVAQANGDETPTPLRKMRTPAKSFREYSPSASFPEHLPATPSREYLYRDDLPEDAIRIVEEQSKMSAEDHYDALHLAIVVQKIWRGKVSRSESEALKKEKAVDKDSRHAYLAERGVTELGVKISHVFDRYAFRLGMTSYAVLILTLFLLGVTHFYAPMDGGDDVRLI